MNIKFPIQQRHDIFIRVFYHFYISVHPAFSVGDAIQHPGLIYLFHVLFLILPALGPRIVKVGLVVGVGFDLVALLLVELRKVEGGVGLALVVGVVLREAQVVRQVLLCQLDLLELHVALREARVALHLLLGVLVAFVLLRNEQK